MTFASLAIVGAGLITALVVILGLPGRIAIARRHPDAEAVNLLAWYGFVTIYPWAQALIWSLKPTDVVDIRNLPREERKEIDEQIARLSGKSTKKREEPDDLPQPRPAASEDQAG